MTEQGKFNAQGMKNMAVKIHQGNQKDIAIANKVADACAVECKLNFTKLCEFKKKQIINYIS